MTDAAKYDAERRVWTCCELETDELGTAPLPDGSPQPGCLECRKTDDGRSERDPHAVRGLLDAVESPPTRSTAQCST